MQKLLRATLFATALLLCVAGGYSVAEAQSTVSPYATVTCQNMRDGSQVCRYGNGTTATCTSSTDGLGGNIIECTNPDSSKTVCRREAVGNLDGRTQGSAGTRNVCTVTNADGTPGGTIDGTNRGGRTDTETTAPDGTVTNDSRSNMGGGGSCSALDIGACIRALPGMLFTGIAFLFLTLSGLILGLAGTVFNWVVIRTVFQFGTYFGTNEGMLIAWGVMRDIANIGLLFGFIFMGVLLILNVDGGGHGHGGGISAKKAIPRLIIFAVLLNFSLFASQAVIDVANAFSASFATLAGENCSSSTSTGTASDADQTNEECSNVGISGQILKVAGLTAIWDSENRDIDAAMKNLLDRPYSYAVSLIMLSVFVLVTAMVLLAGSIMLIIRVVVLSLLMVTSPIGFAGMAIPKLQGIASMWWSKLMSQAFFAPVYLLLIFISIKLTEGLSSGEATLANALIANQGTSVAGNMQVVMVFLVVIGFMIASLIAATKMGAMGAKLATQSVAGATVGFAGFAGRRTLGAASGAVANRIASSSWARSNGLGSRFAYNIANKGATSSYSARTGINNLTKGAGLDIGNANKKVAHGLHGIEEEEVKARVEFAEKTLKQTGAEQAEEARLKQVKVTMQNNKAAEVARRSKEKIDEQKAIEELESTNEAEGTRRLLAIEDQKKAVANAEANKDSDPESVLREKRTLDEMRRSHETATEAAAAAVSSRKQAIKLSETKHEQNLASFDREIKESERQIKGGEFFNPETGQMDKYAGVSSDAVRRSYANTMSHQKVPIPFSVGTHINHEAAEKILKKLNRSQNEKLIDAIKETAREESKTKEKEGGGGDHGGGGGGAQAGGGHGGGAAHH